MRHLHCKADSRWTRKVPLRYFSSSTFLLVSDLTIVLVFICLIFYTPITHSYPEPLLEMLVYFQYIPIPQVIQSFQLLQKTSLRNLTLFFTPIWTIYSLEQGSSFLFLSWVPVVINLKLSISLEQSVLPFVFPFLIHGGCALAKLLQLCLTLYDPMDYSPPGSSIHGILQ